VIAVPAMVMACRLTELTWSRVGSHIVMLLKVPGNLNIFTN
jgi:hypothetical protein